MVSCDGILNLFKEAALKRIEQILLAEWREKKTFYQREGQKRDELIEKLNDEEKQLFEEYMNAVQESSNEKELAIFWMESTQQRRCSIRKNSKWR